MRLAQFIVCLFVGHRYGEWRTFEVLMGFEPAVTFHGRRCGRCLLQTAATQRIAFPKRGGFWAFAGALRCAALVQYDHCRWALRRIRTGGLP